VPAAVTPAVPAAAPPAHIWDRSLRRFDRIQARIRPVAFIGGVLKKSGEDQVSLLAAVMSHFGMLSVFPLLLLLVTLAGYVFRDDAAAQQALIDAALGNFPALGEQLRASIQSLPGSGAAIVFGSVLLLWASLGFTKVAQTAMAEIWRVPRRLRPGFWQNLGRSVWALAALSLPTLVTAAVTIITARVKNPMRAMNDVPSWLLSSIGVTAAVAAAVVFLAFNFGAHLLAFRALTPHVIPTRRLVPGTVLFTLFWTALTAFGSAILASRVARANQLYGTIGFVIGLIFWIYLGAYGALLSSELNAVSTEHLYPRTLFGPPATPADRRALLSRAQTEEFVPGQVVEVRFGPPREPDVDVAAGDGSAGQDGGPHR
jgi:YihY family inner membrane protein